MKKYLLIIFISLLINGCYVGHQGFINLRNDKIGTKALHFKPFKYKNAGEYYRANFSLLGYGVTHVDKDKEGNLIVHWFNEEILPNFYHKKGIFTFGNKKWIGKCLTYKIVDSKTHIIKGWGFDKGGNPLSCKIWS